MKKFLLIICTIFLLASCGASFEQVSAPILAKYGEPVMRTLEEKNKYLPDADMSNITWGYINPRITVLFSRDGSMWKSEITKY